MSGCGVRCQSLQGIDAAGVRRRAANHILTQCSSRAANAVSGNDAESRPATGRGTHCKRTDGATRGAGLTVNSTRGRTMTATIVRLGSARTADEGLRIGTVRRPPRGVPKTAFARQNWYDVWYPNLAPSPETVRLALRATNDREWQAFTRKFRTEMAAPDHSRSLDLLAALSHQANFSVGCYCEDESRCHRSVLRALLIERGAKVA